MAVKFYLDSRPSKLTEENPIRASFSIKGVKLASTIGHSVDIDHWKAGQVTPPSYTNKKGVTAKQINSDLKKIESHFSTWELSLKEKPSTEEIKKEIKKALEMPAEGKAIPAKIKRIGFFQRLQEFITEQSLACGWAESTLKNWKTFKNHMMDFNSNVNIDFFNESGINKYIAFLRKEGLEEKTVQKQYGFLKWFYSWLYRKGYTNNDIFKRYKPKFRVLEKPVIFLTKEELLRLYNFQIPGNGTKVKLQDMYGNEYEKTVEDAGGMSKTRDLFCFCAFTSLRYSDMAALKRTDIDGDTMYITTQKTNDRLPINLNKFAKEILAKYEQCDFLDNLALPVITNQKMNYYLKDLCELAGFTTPITKVCFRGGERVEETFPKWQLIGTHAGRRTFICFALSSGIPPQVVMKWTGHSDYDAMKPYIDIAEKTKVNAMQLFESELEK
ncbi:MAG: phage integrase SAM-like domain-containing protein [Bacteroidales bacterium]|nr:phage integrase SAM-like domain-containing protein [Bacteroidales bacterium]